MAAKLCKIVAIVAVIAAAASIAEPIKETIAEAREMLCEWNCQPIMADGDDAWTQCVDDCREW